MLGISSIIKNLIHSNSWHQLFHENPCAMLVKLLCAQESHSNQMDEISSNEIKIENHHKGIENGCIFRIRKQYNDKIPAIASISSI